MSESTSVVLANETSESSGVKLNPSLTLALAQASLAAYSDFERKPFTPPPNYKFYGRFTGWDDWFYEYGQEERFGLIFKYDGPQMIANRFIVAFRGTNSLSDIYEDAFWSLTEFQPYRNSILPTPNVSVGFYDIYSTLGGTMTKTMQQQVFSMLPPNPSEVLITGHSLGGALSQLFTLDMRVSSPNVGIKTINFASPRVGDSSWKTACDNVGATGKITRAINYWDIAPDYPPEITGYVSIGAQFETAFSRCNWWDYNPLSEHSMLNLQTVLSNCLWLNPQVWVGKFADAVDTNYQMCSTAPPTVSKDEWIAKLKELHDLRLSMQASNTTCGNVE